MIELNLNKNLFVPKFYPYLFDYSQRWCFFMGSARQCKELFYYTKANNTSM